MANSKPGIIVVSSDSEATFRWLSVGWNQAKHAHSPAAKKLMAKANACIKKGRTSCR